MLSHKQALEYQTWISTRLNMISEVVNEWTSFPHSWFSTNNEETISAFSPKVFLKLINVSEVGYCVGSHNEFQIIPTEAFEKYTKDQFTEWYLKAVMERSVDIVSESFATAFVNLSGNNFPVCALSNFLDKVSNSDLNDKERVKSLFKESYKKCHPFFGDKNEHTTTTDS